MNIASRYSGGMVAVIAAAIGSSVLTFLALLASGWLGLPTGRDVPMQIAVILSIIFLWGPAFAMVPAGILGYLVERPLSRRFIERGHGGFVEHLLAVVGAALLLWLFLRVVVVVTGPQSRIVDPLSLAVFAIVGLCSALSWWFIVVLPARRA